MSNPRVKKLYCMCSKTMKQWPRWSLKAEVLQWDTFPGLTELHLIGCLDTKIQIKYIDTKNQLADIVTKGNFTRDEWIICCACSISVISVLQCALIQWRSDLNKIQEKSKSQQNRESYCHGAVARIVLDFSEHGEETLRKSRSMEISCWRKRSDLVKAEIYLKPLIITSMSNSWKASLQQIIQNWMMTLLGLLKSGKLILRHTSDRGDLIKLLGEWYEKFDLVSLTRKFVSTEPRNPLGTRKHLVTDRDDLITSILKKWQDLKFSSWETKKQNWNCL